MFSATTSIGVDIGDDAIHLVELRAAGSSFVVVKATAIALPEEDRSPEAFSAALASVLPRKRARVAVAIPAAACTFKTATLPPAKPAELAQVIQFEAEAQFPLGLDELAWGYAITPNAGQVHAAMAGARRALVNDRLTMLQHLGMTPDAILVAPLAAAAALPPIEGFTVVVVAGREWSDLCLFDSGRLLGCRSFLAGSSATAGWSERLAREIRPWMAGTPLSQVIVLGGNDTRSLNALSRLLGVAVSCGDPWTDIDDPSGCLQKLDDAPSSFATAVGLALAALTRQPGINLLPQHVTDRRKQQRKTVMTISALALAALLLAPLALLNRQTIHDQQEQLAEYSFQTQHAYPTKTAPLQGGLQVTQQAITALQQPASTPVELLYLLSDKLPDGIMLTDFTFDRGRVAVLKGRAESNTVLAESLQAINRVGLLDRAMLDYSNQLKDAGQYNFDFQITCTLPTTTDPTSASKRKGTNTKSQTGITQAQ